MIRQLFFGDIDYSLSSASVKDSQISSATGSDGDSGSRSFAEDGFTTNELIVVLLAFCGVLVIAALIYKKAISNNLSKIESVVEDEEQGSSSHSGGLSEIPDELNMNENPEDVIMRNSFEVDVNIEKKPSDISDVSHWTMDNTCRKVSMTFNPISSCFGTNTMAPMSDAERKDANTVTLNDINLSEDDDEDKGEQKDMTEIVEEELDNTSVKTKRINERIIKQVDKKKEGASVNEEDDSESIVF